MPARVRPLRTLLIVVGIVLATVLLGACQGSSNPQDTLSPQGPVARTQTTLFYTVFWIAVVIFFAVEGTLLYVMFRFRHRRGPEEILPKQVHGNTRMEIGWTIAPTLLLAIIAIPTVATIYNLRPSEKNNPLHVTVVGHQWWWEFKYDELGITTANEMHIPANRPVNITLQSKDVIHAFHVPSLAGQIDAVPGHDNLMWLQADNPGTYLGQCTQFCGESHAFMRFRVIADAPNDFDAWAANQKAGPVAPTGNTQAGAQLFATGSFTVNGTQYQCIACHTIQGVSQGQVGPNLTHFDSRTTFAGATLDNTPDEVARWLHNPQAIKPGAIMPNLHLTDQQIADLVAYLESLK
jgi:cytochrome c oxidase subunit 2